jgi:hypothetical protein
MVNLTRRRALLKLGMTSKALGIKLIESFALS